MQQDYRKLSLDMQRRAAEMAGWPRRDRTSTARRETTVRRYQSRLGADEGCQLLRPGLCPGRVGRTPVGQAQKRDSPHLRQAYPACHRHPAGQRTLYPRSGRLVSPNRNTSRVGKPSRRGHPAKVPYARIHNEGGRVSQYVRPFSRRLVSPNRNTGSVGKPSRRGHPVAGFFRRATYPRRQYLGISPDIFVSAHKDIAYAIRRALNSH